MEGVNVTDVGTLAGLRGIGGYGYGAHGGHGNGFGNFPGDGSAVKEAVRGNRDINIVESVNRTAADQAISDRISSGHQNLNSQIVQGNEFLTDRINAQSIDAKFANVAATLAAQDRQILAGFASAERLAFSNQQTLVAQLHAMDIKQTECCCELKAGQSAIQAKLDNQSAIDAAVAAARNESRLDAILAGCGNGRGRGNGNGNNG